MVIVAFPGIQALDVVGPFEVFVGARQVMESHCDATAALLRGLLAMPDSSPRRDGSLS